MKFKRNFEFIFYKQSSINDFNLPEYTVQERNATDR